MYRDVIFLGGAGEGEGVPLPVRNFGARKEDVLPSLDLRALLLDLHLHDFARMLNDLRDIRDMATADFTEDTLDDEHDTPGEPISPEHAHHIVVAGVVVRSNHAEHAVQLPTDKKDDE